MRCRTCDYPLWNLPGRSCPECGAGFRPGDYEFLPSAVRFGCPHCGQVYYGTDAKGHLVPRAFTCAACARAIDMDEMVLAPAEGVGEDRAMRKLGAPWLERDRRGWWRAWLATVGRAMVAPRDLMRALPPGRLAEAWKFAGLTIVLTMAGSMLTALPIWGVMIAILATAMPPGGPTPGVMLAAMGGMTVGSIAFSIVFQLVMIVLWGLLVHGLLRLTGPVTEPIGRTFQALCYSSGAYVTAAAPCIGQMGFIWWIVSAVLAVKEVHRTSGVRATFAVVSAPVSFLVLAVGAWVAMMALMSTARSTAWVSVGPVSSAQSDSVQRTQRVVAALQGYAGGNSGAGPGHALELVTEDRPLVPQDFVVMDTKTDTAGVPAGAGTLDDLFMLPPAEQAEVAGEAALALPRNVIAHRVGDFVFTYHGIDLTKWQPGMWVVIMSPDPAANPGPPPSIVVGMSDGSVLPVRGSDFALMLRMQNRHRSRAGLPPLPDPASVTHDQPAVAGP